MKKMLFIFPVLLLAVALFGAGAALAAPQQGAAGGRKRHSPRGLFQRLD